MFFVAALISGGDLSPSTAWLHPVTLIAAGLTLAMLHAAGVPWRRGGG